MSLKGVQLVYEIVFKGVKIEFWCFECAFQIQLGIATRREIFLAPEIARPAVAAYDAVIAELGGLDPSSSSSNNNNSDSDGASDGGGGDGGGGGGGGGEGEEKDPAARNMAAAGGRTDGGSSGSEGGSEAGKGAVEGDAAAAAAAAAAAGEAWLRDADAYMASPILLNTSQQVRLAPFFNREMSRRDEPRIPGGALGWDTLKVRTLSAEPLVLVVDDVFRPEARPSIHTTLKRLNSSVSSFTTSEDHAFT